MKVLNYLICSLFLFSGCSHVVSKHPIGIENYAISSDDWDDVWFMDMEVKTEHETMTIKVVDERKGIFKLAWIESTDNDLKLEFLLIQIKKGKTDLYFNVLEMSEEEYLEGFYYWGKVKKEKQKIIFLLPSVEAFKKAYENNKIQAIVEQSSGKTKSGEEYSKSITIKIIDEPQVIVDLIERNKDEYFDYEDPILILSRNIK